MRHPEVAALLGLAVARQQLGQLHEAVGYVRRALTLARDADYQLLEALALTTLADLHLSFGHFDEAVECARQALAILAEIGAPEVDQVRALTG